MAWRLVPGALAGWLIAWVVLLAARIISPTQVGAAAFALLLASAASVRWSRSLAATLLICAVVTVSAAVHLASLSTGPVAEHVGSRVTAEVSIVGDLRVRESSMFDAEPSLEARAHLSRLDTPLGAWEVGAPILLRLPLTNVPQRGALLRVTGTLRPGDPIRGTAAAIEPASVAVIAEPGVLDRWANAFRHSLVRALEGGDPRATALVAGLAVGDETLQPPELADQMRVSGLSHLTAVSGGNTALIVGAVLALAALLGLGVVPRAVLAAAALGMFVVIVGPQPSVLRAAVMGLVALVALVAGASRNALAALAFAIVVLLVLAPGMAASWGFGLSVWATAGLVLLSGPLVERLPLRGARTKALASALAVTIAAQIATAPLIASFGNGLSLVAVPANLLAAPVVAPVTILGLLAAVAGLVSPVAGEVLARVAEPMAAWIAAVAEVSAAAPLATLPWPGGWLGAFLGLLAAAGLVLWIRRRRGRHERFHLRRVAAVVGAVTAIAVLVGARIPERAGWPPPGWVMVACDVGQGDGVVLRGSGGGVVVVDTGPEPEPMQRCLSDLGIGDVDLLVLTHPHIDHVGGVPGVIADHHVIRALVSPLREPVEQVERVEQWLVGVPIETAQVGSVRDVGGVHVEILWPQRIIRGPESVPNNASIVMLVEVSGVRFLLFGDVETAAQVALRTSLQMGGVDVVKVPHHGSRLQDPALAAWTGGRVAVVTVGEGNRYGHPAPETLDQWRAAGAVVARTDEVGDVAVVHDEMGDLGVVTRRVSR